MVGHQITAPERHRKISRTPRLPSTNAPTVISSPRPGIGASITAR
jgi:hypothetical protein